MNLITIVQVAQIMCTIIQPVDVDVVAALSGNNGLKKLGYPILSVRPTILEQNTLFGGEQAVYEVPLGNGIVGTAGCWTINIFGDLK